MAQPASNPKIEELRFRLKTDPKSRLFYPLAEELRKIHQHAEAEQVLLLGLTTHPTYLSAWVSLGRVLREQGKNREAVAPLSKALQLDPGNVVAARALADAYLALGQKVEAIKKYKLVQALLPSDQDLVALIAQLDREIHPEPAAALAEREPEPEPETAAPSEAGMEHEPQRGALPPMPTLETPFGDDVGVFARAIAAEERQRIDVSTGDVEPMSVRHTESPFEEPTVGFGDGSDAFGVEQPEGMHISRAPVAAEVAAPFEDERLPSVDAAPVAPEPIAAQSAMEETADVFAPAEEPPAAAAVEEPHIETGIASELPFALEAALPPPGPDDFTKTITMADLYAGQGLIDEARDIYEDILARDPSNESVRAKLVALSGMPPPPAATYDESDDQHDTEVQEPGASPPAFATQAVKPVVVQPQEEHGWEATPPLGEALAEHAGPPILPVEGVHDEPEQAVTTDQRSEAEAGSRARIARLERWLSKVGRREAEP